MAPVTAPVPDGAARALLFNGVSAALRLTSAARFRAAARGHRAGAQAALAD
jgi:hypothetical protein